jgi:hypothetical protein
MMMFSLLGVGVVEEVDLEEADTLSVPIDTLPCMVAMNAANWSNKHREMSGLLNMTMIITCYKSNRSSRGDWNGHAGGDGAMNDCGGV